MYYNIDKILTYNAFINILIGERGVGKTFSVSEFVTRQFIKKKYEFAYIRRYKTEISKSAKKFFEALKQEGKFTGHDLYTKGSNFIIDDAVAGYSMPLTTAQSLKSVNFSRVKYIIFDEFILENGSYLKNEVEIFLGLVETIARMRDVKIFMLGNAVTQFNPYFMFFNLTIPYNNDIKTFKDGLILVQYMNNTKYREEKKKSKFGRLVADTEYEEYAINNSFRLENNDFISKKSGHSKFSFAMKYKSNIIGIWIDWNDGKMYASFDYDKNGCLFACTNEDHTPNTMLLSMGKKYRGFKLFIDNYKMGNVYFENNKIKSISNEILRLLMIR